ncbi:hypothetical protein SCOR_31575 [Sulfidibacter corallicola]
MALREKPGMVFLSRNQAGQVRGLNRSKCARLRKLETRSPKVEPRLWDTLFPDPDGAWKAAVSASPFWVAFAGRVR